MFCSLSHPLPHQITHNDSADFRNSVSLLPVTLDQASAYALDDWGADESFIPLHLVAFPHKITRPSDTPFMSANSLVPIVGRYTTKMYLGNRGVDVTFNVVQKFLYFPLLGEDWRNAAQLKTTRFPNGVKCYEAEDENGFSCLNLKIMPRTPYLMQFKQLAKMSDQYTNFSIDLHKDLQQYITAEKDSKLAMAQELWLMKAAFSIEKQQVIDMMTPTTDEQIAKTILEFAEVVFTGANLGCSKNFIFEIELTDTEPCEAKGYHYSFQDGIDIRGQLDFLKRMIIIHLANNCSYNAPILIIRQNGKVRMVIDFRALNKKTKIWTCRMVDIAESLNEHAGMFWFGIIDLKSAYWQVRIQLDDCEKTCFSGASEGHWHWLRMPFGLVNAPAMFQKISDYIVRRVRKRLLQLGLRDKCRITGYLDDYCISAVDRVSFYELVAILLDEIKQEGLTIGLDKCELMKSEITYLGHHIGRNGVRPGPGKIDAITNFPRPENVAELRRFLGMAGFLRKFIPKFSILATGLHKLLQKTQKWTWGLAQQLGFDLIKRALSTAPVLCHFDPQKQTVIYMDVSYSGIAGAMFQIEKGSKGQSQQNLVACFSRTLLPAEKSLHSNQPEAIGVRDAIFKQFDIYLRGVPHEPLCYTDNNLLMYSMTKKKLSRAYEAVVMDLQEMLPHVIVKHISGAKNQVADALSRAPTKFPEEDFREPQDILSATFGLRMPALLHSMTALPPQEEHLPISDNHGILFYVQKYNQQLMMEQRCDEFCLRVLEALGKNDKSDYKHRHLRKQFFMLQGIHCLKAKRTTIVLPKCFRRHILTLYHDHNSHFAITKTVHAIKQKYYWPGMTRDVSQHCQSCQTCKTFNPAHILDGQLHSQLAPSQPYLILCMDHEGPLGKTKHENQYMLVVVDNASRFAWAVPTESTDAKSVVQFLETFCYRHGDFAEIIHDQGSAFESKLFKDWCNKNHIISTHSHSHFQQANGLAEKVNHILLSILKRTLGDHFEKDWDQYLEAALAAYNGTLQKSLGCTPFFYCHGFDPNKHGDTLSLTADDRTAIERLQELDEARRDAAFKLYHAQEAMKKYYDSKHRDLYYEIGDLVYYDYHPPALPGKSRKWLPKFEGLFQVVSRKQDSYLIMRIEPDLNHFCKKWVHISQLKWGPYIDTSDFDVDMAITALCYDENHVSNDSFETVVTTDFPTQLND